MELGLKMVDVTSEEEKSQFREEVIEKNLGIPKTTNESMRELSEYVEQKRLDGERCDGYIVFVPVIRK
jgi:hypothetical protein